MEYVIRPTNEGQDLNYMETYSGTLDGAKNRAEFLRRALQNILHAGDIGCGVFDSGKLVYSTTEEASLKPTAVEIAILNGTYGGKIAAFKAYRQRTDASLAETRAAFGELRRADGNSAGARFPS